MVVYLRGCFILYISYVAMTGGFLPVHPGFSVQINILNLRKLTISVVTKLIVVSNASSLNVLYRRCLRHPI